MRKMLGSLLKAGTVCGMLMVINLFTSLAAIGPESAAGTYVATIATESVNINKSQGGEEVLIAAKAGNVYEVPENMGNGWMKIRVNDSEGFLPIFGNATVGQVGENEMVEVQQGIVESSDTYKRQRVVSYTIQFIGGRYEHGGSDPRTGTDCSGSTRCVFQNSAGISMNRSSSGQAQQGIAVSTDQVQPGDLVSHGSGRGINHVAIYVGNGQVVYASAGRIGITVSNRNYRDLVKIVNVLE